MISNYLTLSASLFYHGVDSGIDTTLENASSLERDNESLGQVATKFLLTLPTEKRPKAQQEVYKFVRWYGEKRPIAAITNPEVANYAERVTSSTIEASEKLRVIKALLSYAYKQGLTRNNLSVHLKSTKASPKPTSSRQRPRSKILMTSKGYADLQAELAALKNERPRVAEELQKAASDKDFRENAPLEAAREHQGHLEGRIRELESTLKMAVLDAELANSSAITFGDTVTLRDLASSEKMTFTLVDASEANPSKSKISVASPIGQALLGQKKGQRIQVKAPAGTLHYEIQDTQHQSTPAG